MVSADAETASVELYEEDGAPLEAPATFSVADLLRRDAELFEDGALRVDDLTEVRELHGAEVLHALDVRFAHGAIYTLTGPVLLAVNPFRMLPSMYSPDILRHFLGVEHKGLHQSKPHVFGISAQALWGIQDQGVSQTVLISGESGAGKTETTKFVMQFLALAGAGHVAAAPEPASGDGMRKDSISMTPTQSMRSTTTAGASRADRSSMSRVERQVLGSNPLLEAFGNAKTLRNDNSSRFGKYIELQFGLERPGLSVPPRLVGAYVRTYLLEKVRVIRQQVGERNFHVFYQALAAAQTPSRLTAMRVPVAGAAPGQTLTGPSHETMRHGGAEHNADVDLAAFTGFSVSSFSYLGGGQASSRSDITSDVEADAESFKTTIAAIRAVGLGSQSTSAMFRALAAVLHLGNIEFSEVNSETSEVCSSASRVLGARMREEELREPLELTRTLLGVSSDALVRCLCTRTMQAPGEAVIRMTLNVKRAAESRDALARHLYHTIFSHVVACANKAVGFQEGLPFCGVLDIFGFEFFETNSFEQLCINYTNELLQQYFNTFIFQTEAALYRDECIEWEALEFPDNGAIVQLLQEKQIGVLPMLEEECFITSGTSDSWHGKVVKQHDAHPNFSSSRLKPGCFQLQHFAGPVTYTCANFLEKNKDQLSSDIQQCLKQSTCAFVRDRFSEQERNLGAAPTSMQDSGRVLRAQRYTVSSEFRQQLQNLLAQIRATEPHFIRCIKPNQKNRPFVEAGERAGVPLFDRAHVAEQLRYQGVLEAIRVARAGFPIRMKHLDFLGEFRCLAMPELHIPCRHEEEDHDFVEEVREFSACARVQKLLTSGGGGLWAIGKTRVFMKQEPYSALRTARLEMRHEAATVIQARWRRFAATRAFARLLRAVRSLQAAARSLRARRELRARRRELAAIDVQACLRMRLLRRRLALARQAILAAQAWIRGQRCQAEYQAVRAAVLRLQRWRRSLLKRRRLRRLQADILRIQAAWRRALAYREAAELKARLHRVKLALRTLLRIRRANAKRRLWRAQVMADYKGKPTLQAPPKLALQAALAEVLRKFEASSAELREVKAETQLWQDRANDVRDRAFLRFRSLVRATHGEEEPDAPRPSDMTPRPLDYPDDYSEW